MIIEYDIIYGDESAPYALYVHEGHKQLLFGKDRGLKPYPANKFLESAVYEQGSPFYEKLMAAGLKRLDLI